MMTILRDLVNGGIVGILAKGGLVMIPLLTASVISLAVIIERFLFWRRLRKRENDTIILQFVEAGNVEQAQKLANESRHPVARVLLAGLEYRQLSPATAMEATAQAELRRVKAYLPILDTIITLAPLLGLLGTITGMIGAFGIVSEAGLGQPTAITGGVAEALIATAAGLSIAIMTLIPYNYFRAQVEQLTERMEEQASRLELFLCHRGT
jgi:biopolymer transport protein ExbB